ncbi:helix-turn-helix domain-containing protein [Pontibacter cellulosilyticus]|uniref:Helix-turn-helix domain-containing protein n=1 Tax=Pontibacter cellulosilyticus TaxID=1720253 RepID=A0A923SJ70_9BACT|nr:helix-turn-helix domain-containing protein [Pontibacter cellulosilyticus]MBC5992411.1 helix-turn-helix domain-containing protein [Pontibacter cellulosilyticus]
MILNTSYPQLSFEQLPNAVSALFHMVERLETNIQEHFGAVVAPERPISPEKAAELLNMKLPTLYAKVRQGLIPHYKPSGGLYFFPSELIEWVKKGRIKTTAEIQAEARKGLRRG